jgi:hypothetical protein
MGKSLTREPEKRKTEMPVFKDREIRMRRQYLIPRFLPILPV